MRKILSLITVFIIIFSVFSYSATTAKWQKDKMGTKAVMMKEEGRTTASEKMEANTATKNMKEMKKIKHKKKMVEKKEVTGNMQAPAGMKY